MRHRYKLHVVTARMNDDKVLKGYARDNDALAQLSGTVIIVSISTDIQVFH